MAARAAAVAALAVVLGAAGPAEPATAGDTAFAASEGGVLIHQGSGLRFPADVAGFRRSEAAAFAGNGDYVGLEYIRAVSVDGDLTMHIAVVNIPGLSPREHYVITKPVVLHSLDEARTVAEGPFRRIAGSAAYRGLFTGQQGGIPWMRGLWTFEHGDWDLRVRADFPRIDQIQADEAVAEFVSALNALNGQQWERELDREIRHRRPSGGSS